MKTKRTIAFLFLTCFFLCIPKVFSISISAESACLILADTEEVLFAKNEFEELPMASTTKIMTSILAVELIEACGDKEVEITEEMIRVEGTSMGLQKGDILSLESLVKGMLLCSGNDAATASAMAVGGDVENFAKMMNEKARQIGMNRTNFVTPSGLDSGDHHSTAYDMAILGAYAMSNEKFSSIASKKSDKVEFISPPKIVSYKNHNKLLRLYDSCIGVKTGFTKAAGRCLVSCAKRNEVKLIAVTLNAPNDWQDHKNMLDYGFMNTTNILFNDKEFKSKVQVKNGVEDEINVSGVSSFSCSFKKGDETRVERIVDLCSEIEAPVEKGQIVGKVIYYLDEKEIGRNEILSENEVRKRPEKMNFIKNIINMIKNILKKSN